MSSFESGAYERSGFKKLLGVGATTVAQSEKPSAQPILPAESGASPKHLAHLANKNIRPLCIRAVSDDGRYEFQNGELFRAIPGRNLFRLVHDKLPRCGDEEQIIIRVSPLNPNYLWIGFGKHGLYFSEDGGYNFRQIPNVSKVDALALKRDQQAEHGVRVQMAGNIQQLGFRKFQSSDKGKSWATATRSCVIDLSKNRIN